MSVASVAVLMSCLVVLGAFVLLVANLNKNLDNIAKLNVIMVFCDYDLEEGKAEEIGSDIKKLSNVDKCEYISKEESLEKMKEESGDSGIYDDMTGENNPLCESFEVTYTNDDETEVFNLEAELRNIDGVRKINSVYQTAKTIDSFKRGITIVFSIFLLILFVVSLFVIINTIKLAVYARRHEITVMRYVGATNGFITIPFVFEGIIIGVAASAVAYAIELVIYNYIAKSAFSSVAFISIIDAPTVAVPLFFGFIGVGMLTGIIGSVASLRKYLKS
jgi:cell division transport system permease protein